MADDAMRFLVRGAAGTTAMDAGAALTAAIPAAKVSVAGETTPRTIPEHLAFVGRTQKTQELPGAPTDLPIGYHRIVWNTTTNRPSCWMNRAGTIIDAFDPGTF